MAKTAMRVFAAFLVALSTTHALSATTRRGALKGLSKAAGAYAAAAVVGAQAARAAEGASPFVGRFTDPINHPGGIRDITLSDTKLGQFQLATVKGGGGRGEPKSYELPAMVFNDKITVDFSPKGGPRDLTGTFVDGVGIKWPDGKTWPKVDR